MKKEHLKYLVCPDCKTDLELITGYMELNNRIESGILVCSHCSKKYNIINNIPRFVPIDNYSSSFGFEWLTHSRTQYDSYSGVKESETRFFSETKWGRELHGQLVLEAGSGSGRFTEQALKTGATVISFDYSQAVEANYASNGKHENVLILQASIYAMPFKKEFFDKIFCIGVIQHTPEPEKSFKTLTEFLKLDGSICIDNYRKSFLRIVLSTKYWVRPFTKKIENEKLYQFFKKYIDFMWPVYRFFRKFGWIGKNINWALLIPDYSKLGLSDEMQKEWAYLDAFDMLSPEYDFPQTLNTVKKWFVDAGLKDIDVHYGWNGIEGRGKK